jgi:hypothetical protein
MNVRLRVALLPLCALILAASPRFARGQAVDGKSTTAAAVTASATAAGPTLQSLPVGVRARTTPVDSVELAAFQRRGSGLGQPEALMIVGGAAILIGAIIGDDAGAFFMVGGAVVGLYGLYKYLQ